MTRALSRVAAVLSLALLAGMSATVCAADIAPATLEAGRKLFTGGATPACAVCHTLTDAGATGAIGPSLDELKPDLQRVQTVLRSGLGVMPAYDSLTEEQRKTLAEYVAHVTGAG